MAIQHKNETPEQREDRIKTDIAARQAAKEKKEGIRCYGEQGFEATIMLPDGTKIQKYCYGHDGD